MSTDKDEPLYTPRRLGRMGIKFPPDPGERPLRGRPSSWLACQIARQAHAGQTRRDGVRPYIEHPRDVVSRLPDDVPDEVEAVAWLHDVLEDTSTTIDDLMKVGFPERIIRAVHAISKRKGEDYDVYLARVKMDRIARQVKIADMLANLADDPTDKQIVKYAKGLLALVP